MTRQQISEKVPVTKKKPEASIEETKEQKFVTYLRSLGGMDVHQFDDANEAYEYGKNIRKNIEDASLIDVEIAYKTVRIRLKQ